MDIANLKQYIYDNGKVVDILESIDCHHIKYHTKYWTCANSDGDNQQAISVYNSENLNVVNYTRDITKNGKLPSDLISLVCFNKGIGLFDGLKHICSVLGIDYYQDFEEDVPESLKVTKMIFQMQNSLDDVGDEKPLKPISEKILGYYKNYVNDLFYNDGISYTTQQEFQIGYDPETNRITIPIFDEVGSLIGVKARLFKKKVDDGELKYIYLEPCARSKVLYGLNKTIEHIKNVGECVITESEKGVLQLWSMEIYNSVGIGGKKVTSQQIEKLTRLGVDLVFAFDKDVTKKEIEEIADRFVDGVNIFYIWDDKGILDEKESPMDSKEKWDLLYNNCKYKIK